MTKDITLNKESAYGSVSWVAQRLGFSKGKFLGKRQALEREGFPKKDTATGFYHKGDVDAWIEGRRRIPDANVVKFSEPRNRTEVKLDAL